MEIVTEHQHRLLAFINACNRAGYSPTDEEVAAWFEAPVPREAEYRSKTLPPLYRTPLGLGDFLNQNGNFSNSILTDLVNKSMPSSNWWFSGLTSPRTVREETRPAETPIEHMVRILWLHRSEDDRLKATSLGKAMLQSAESEAMLIEDLTVMYLGADDPLAYPLLVGALADLESGLLIDPYLRVEQVDTLYQQTRIDRLLVGSGDRHRKDNAAIATYLKRRNGDDRVEVRESYQLHDRVLIEPNGSVSILGTSMNAVGRKATILMGVPDVAAQQLNAHYEELWAQADVLYPLPEEEESSEDEHDPDKS